MTQRRTQIREVDGDALAAIGEVLSDLNHVVRGQQSFTVVKVSRAILDVERGDVIVAKVDVSQSPLTGELVVVDSDPVMGPVDEDTESGDEQL